MGLVTTRQPSTPLDRDCMPDERTTTAGKTYLNDRNGSKGRLRAASAVKPGLNVATSCFHSRPVNLALHSGQQSYRTRLRPRWRPREATGTGPPAPAGPANTAPLAPAPLPTSAAPPLPPPPLPPRPTDDCRDCRSISVSMDGGRDTVPASGGTSLTRSPGKMALPGDSGMRPPRVRLAHSNPRTHRRKNTRSHG